LLSSIQLGCAANAAGAANVTINTAARNMTFTSLVEYDDPANGAMLNI
jgi:hypothetical protein